MDDVLSFLNDYCWKHKIGIQYISYMNPKDPSLCYEWPRLIIYNENWHIKQEKPFILAHEIGHVMCGDANFYYKNHNGKNKEECTANKFAIKLLKKYCKENDIFFESNYCFARAFGIPKRLYYLLEEV